MKKRIMILMLFATLTFGMSSCSADSKKQETKNHEGEHNHGDEHNHEGKDHEHSKDSMHHEGDGHKH